MRDGFKGSAPDENVLYWYRILFVIEEDTDERVSSILDAIMPKNMRNSWFSLIWAPE